MKGKPTMKSFIRITLILIILTVTILSAALSSWAEEPPPAPPAAPIEAQATTKIFLPFIIRSIFPLLNGNFESGKTVWAVSSTHNLNVIIQSYSPNSATPHGGNWGAWLGGGNGETTTIQQQVTIPTNAPYLGYWHWIGSGDICGYDKAAILINGKIVHQYDLCSPQNTGGWRKKVVNLSTYGGQTVTLRFRVQNDSSLNSNLFLDDIAFQGTATLTSEEVVEPITLMDDVITETGVNTAPKVGITESQDPYSLPKP
jgi:hypothetical protein